MQVLVYGQKPELVAQTSSTSLCFSVAFSRDGRILANASVDKTIKLWDLANGSQLRSLTGNASIIRSVAFSQDGKTLASGSDDAAVKLWDVVSGKELRSFVGHASQVTSVVFSPDGKLLATGSTDRKVKLWDPGTGKQLASLDQGLSSVLSLVFSPDGKTLASGTTGGSIDLWDVASHERLHTLVGHTSRVHAIAFNSAGTSLASVSGDHTIRLWDVASGALVRTFVEYSDWQFSVGFSPNGKWLVTDSAGEHKLNLWDVQSGDRVRSFYAGAFEPLSVAFSHDSQILASGGHDNTIQLWNVETGMQIRSLEGNTSSVLAVAISPDGRLLATGAKDATIKLWSLASGRELTSLSGHLDFVGSIAFSPDGKTLASGSDDYTVKLWDVGTGTELHSLFGGPAEIKSVAFSPDGTTLAAAGGDSSVRIWNAVTGKQVNSLNTAAKVLSFAFSPDGKILACVGDSPGVTLWDVNTGAKLRSFGENSTTSLAVAFSPNGKMLASGGFGETITVWNVSSGNPLYSLAGHHHTPGLNPGESTSLITSLAFSPDGGTLASGSPDKTIRLWDMATGSQLKLLEGHRDWIFSVAFCANGRILASGSEDATVKLWDVKSGQELASLISLNEPDWLTVTPDGLFDGSPGGWGKIMWRFNNNTFDHVPVEAFYADYYHPGLLAEIVAGDRPKASGDFSRRDRRPISVSLKAPPLSLSEPTVSRVITLQMEVTEASAGEDISDKTKRWPRSGARDLRLFRNGSLVKRWTGDLFALGAKDGCTLQQTNARGARRSICTTTIPIVAGANELTAYAFNSANVKSEDATVTITGGETLRRTGTVYVLTVGVNNYENKAFDLIYAVPDAEEFGSELKRQQDKLKTYGRTEIIPVYDEKATKDNILRVLTDLASRAQPEDAVVVYFAGHGTIGSCLRATAPQTNLKDRFYLVPYDIGFKGKIPERCEQRVLDEITLHSISDVDLETVFQKIDAGQMLLVIDACNSGQALESEEKRRGPMNSKGFAQLAYEKGMYVLTAAQSFQEAKADKTVAKGHGYLTYALMEALKTKVAANSHGDVLVRGWVNYAVYRVPQMQHEEAQERRQFVRRTGKSATEVEDVQTPRVFYRNEPEINMWVVARP